MVIGPRPIPDSLVFIFSIMIVTAGFSGVVAGPVPDQPSLPAPQSVSQDVRGLSVSVEDAEVPVGVGATVEVSGSGADGGSVRLYAVGPRGQVYDTDGTNQAGASISASGSYSAEFSIFNRGGRYVFVAVAPGNDSAFSHGRDTGTSNTRTQRQNVELIRSAYLGSGSDDQLAQTELRTVSPKVAIDSPSPEIEMQAGELEVSGSSNLPDETDLLVSVLEADRDTVLSDNVTLDGESWSSTLDLSDLDPGRYILHVHTQSAGEDVPFWILRANGTRPPTEMAQSSPVGTPTERPTARAPSTRIVKRTVVETVYRTVVRTVVHPTTTTKSGGLDGFGVMSNLTALGIVVILAARRWRR